MKLVKSKIWQISMGLVIVGALAFISIMFFTTWIPMKDAKMSNRLFNSNVKNTLSVIFAGMGFGVGGYVTQALLRNELATPATIGVTPIATMAIIISTILGLTLVESIFFAIAITILFGILLMILIFKSEKVSSNIIVIGLLISGLVLGINEIIINKFNAPRYLTSILNNAKVDVSWNTFYILFPIILVATIGLLGIAKKIQIIEHDDTHAKNLGINTKLITGASFLLIIVVIVCSVMLLGMVTFASLAGPLLVRYVFKTNNIWVNIIVSIILTIAFLLVGDILIRYKSYLIISIVPISISAILIIRRMIWK